MIDSIASMGVPVTRTRAFGHVGIASLAAGLLSLIAAAGCQDAAKPSDEPEPPDPVQPLVAGPARDVQLIAQRAVLGFREDRGAFRAGYATHDVTVQDGIAELTPYHYPAPAPGATAAARITGGTLGVETGAITREDGTLLGGAAQARTNGDGAVEIMRGAVVEVLTNREDGIEQAWKFATAPEGTGDLTVEVQISGQTFAGKTDRGLHFQSSTGLGFRYGHALWLDAAGHEWPIQVAWNAGRIAITVPGDIVAQTTFPATLDPIISAEAAIDTQVNGSTGTNSLFPAVAFDGTNYLVVWSDQRVSRDEDIFATLVSPAGAILSPTGIPVSVAPGRQLHPTVAFDGTRYVVAWEDGKVTGGTEADIAAATVSTTGVVTQLGHVAASAQNETTPKLAGNGAGALLVWNNAGDVRAALFTGTAFGGAIDITADAAIQSAPTVAANPGGNYLVAYSEGPTATADLRGAFVTGAGALSGAAFTISAGAGRQYDPSAAFDGTNYVVAWTNNNVGINLFGARVSPAGVVLDTRTEGATTGVGGVSISSITGNQELESLTCKPGACLVVWQESRNLATTSFDIYAQLLTVVPALTNSGPEIIVSNATRQQFVPAVTTNGTGFFAVWQDARDINTNTVFGARITAAGAITDPSGLMLVTGNNRESSPALGRAGTTFGVFWTDSRSYGTDIELARFSGQTKLDATARAVSSAAFAQASPAVTSSAGNFFVVWNDSRGGIDRDIYGARVSASGGVLDPAGRPITTATGDQLVPDIATNGAVSLVVWQDRRNGSFDIFGALVDNTTGNVTVSDLAISTAAGDQTRPRVAFDSTTGQFVVVWSDARIAGDVNVFGARVSAAGAVLDAAGVQISGAANGQFSPRLSFVAGTGLVVWEDRRLDTQGDIFGARITAGTALGVLDPSGFSISGGAAGQQSAPAVAALSGSFLVAWTDGRNLATTGTDIFGQQVGTSGALNGAAFAISTDVEDEDTPVLSDIASNATRIAYTKTRPDLQTTRIATRTIVQTSGTGQACSSDNQCTTGFCVDSHCCDTACGGNNKTDCQACAHSITLAADGTCAFIPSVTRCRTYASTFCDLPEYCTGTSAECPADIGRNQGMVCNSVTGSVCPPNAAPGPHACP
jgi:hypothetical protein